MTALDADKDGKLSVEEIKNAVAALKTLDKNEDGVLEASELASPRGGQRGGPGGGRGGFGGDTSAMVDRFMERDTDKDGKLSKEEGGDRMARAFDTGDANKDGFLDKEEIETMVKGWMSGGGGRGGRGGGGGPKSKENRPAFDDN
jgi:Ca2+-binding EF-hand superfamily protein